MINLILSAVKAKGFLTLVIRKTLLSAFFFTVLQNSAVSNEVISLNLRIHIMRDIAFQASSRGITMTNDHITPAIVKNELLPEVNKIWDPAGIVWTIESVIEEPANKPSDFEQLKAIVEHADRDEEGRSDSERLKPLYQFMNPQFMHANNHSAGKKLYHLYIFPFIGNRSQGNAMKSFDSRVVVASWSNKHNNGGIPFKRNNSEDHQACVIGSLGRTIAHELGHLLGMKHSDCKKCLMAGNCGYSITPDQIKTVRAEANKNSI
jgi:hypothetical protein